MALSPVRAAALAERLEIPFDGICLACLSFVSSAVRGGDERDGPRSTMARALVLELGQRLFADEEARSARWEEVMRNGDG